MTQTAIIRTLTAADVSTYRSLRMEMVTAHPFAFLSDGAEVAAVTDAVLAKRIATPPHSQVFGAFKNTTLVGAAGFFAGTRSRTRHKGAIWGVYVQPDHRNQGFAERLVVEAMELARSRVAVVMIGAVADNAPALGLYRRLGFQEWGREPMAICVDGVFKDEVHLALRFDAKDN